MIGSLELEVRTEQVSSGIMSEAPHRGNSPGYETGTEPNDTKLIATSQGDSVCASRGAGGSRSAPSATVTCTGPFRCFPIQGDDHLLTVLRYVERNPVAAGLVERAEDWHGQPVGAAARGRSDPADARPLAGRMSRGPDQSGQRALNHRDLKSLKTRLERGRPFGDEAWTNRIASSLALGHTIRPEGRPRKENLLRPRFGPVASLEALPPAITARSID